MEALVVAICRWEEAAIYVENFLEPHQNLQNRWLCTHLVCPRILSLGHLWVNILSELLVITWILFTSLLRCLSQNPMVARDKNPTWISLNKLAHIMKPREHPGWSWPQGWPDSTMFQSQRFFVPLTHTALYLLASFSQNSFFTRLGGWLSDAELPSLPLCDVIDTLVPRPAPSDWLEEP